MHGARRSWSERGQTLLDRKAILSPDDVLLHPADVTNVGEAGGLIDHALGHFGVIDVLINNAGIIEVGPVEDQPLETFEKAMQTNFFGALHMIQAVLPHMLARHRAGERRAGAIVNIASIGGKFAMPHLLPYVASKFALVGLSEGLHAELRGRGIRVTTVCPGLMRTGSTCAGALYRPEGEGVSVVCAWGDDTGAGGERE